MPERIAGIDFGTSASVMCVKSYDDEGVPLGNDIFSVKSVAVNNGNSTIPTLIRKTGGTPYRNIFRRPLCRSRRRREMGLYRFKW